METNRECEININGIRFVVDVTEADSSSSVHSAPPFVATVRVFVDDIPSDFEADDDHVYRDQFFDTTELDHGKAGVFYRKRTICNDTGNVVQRSVQQIARDLCSTSNMYKHSHIEESRLEGLDIVVDFSFQRLRSQQYQDVYLDRLIAPFDYAVLVIKKSFELEDYARTVVQTVSGDKLVGPVPSKYLMALHMSPQHYDFCDLEQLELHGMGEEKMNHLVRQAWQMLEVMLFIFAQPKNVRNAMKPYQITVYWRVLWLDGVYGNYQYLKLPIDPQEMYSGVAEEEQWWMEPAYVIESVEERLDFAYRMYQ